MEKKKGGGKSEEKRGQEIMKFHAAQEKKITTVRGSGAQVFQSPLFNKQVGNFYGKDFASRLYLQEGLRGTRNWPTNSGEGLMLVTIRDFHSALFPISFPEFSIPLLSETRNERVSSVSFPVPLDKFIEDYGNEICSTSPTTRCSSPLESLKTLP